VDILSWPFKTDTSHDNDNIEMFKDRMFICQLSELPSSLEMIMFYNQNLEISRDLSLLECIKSEKKRESRVIQEMAKQPELIWKMMESFIETAKSMC
jgi:hypothetical protein